MWTLFAKLRENLDRLAPPHSPCPPLRFPLLPPSPSHSPLSPPSTSCRDSTTLEKVTLPCLSNGVSCLQRNTHSCQWNIQLNTQLAVQHSCKRGRVAMFAVVTQPFADSYLVSPHICFHRLPCTTFHFFSYSHSETAYSWSSWSRWAVGITNAEVKVLSRNALNVLDMHVPSIDLSRQRLYSHRPVLSVA